jgi:chromosome segregation ATPase
MSNEKYVNYYIELITNTMQDAVLRNVSLQTNARISDEVINEQSEKIKHLENVIVDLKEKDNLIDTLRKEINELLVIRGDYENIKHQVGHVNTFRNELVKEREEHEKTRSDYETKISELNEKIDYLKLTPAKRKKIEEEKNNLTAITTETIEKDGGMF